MRVLVTGGTGFLGSHVARRLVADGHDVTVLRRGSSSMSALDGVAVRPELGNVGDAESMLRAVDGQEVVIHAAAGITGNPARAGSYEINVTGTRNVVDACVNAGVRRLVHVSSVAAIGIPKDETPIDETFVFNLDRSKLYYHLSKHRAEGVVRDGAARGLDGVIVNPGSLWGPFPEGYRGADVVRMVRAAPRLKVTPGGVCIAHVDDVAGGILAAMDRGVGGERYILGGDNLTYREWMTRITAALDVAPRIVSVPGVAVHLLAATFGALAGLHAKFHAPYVRSTFGGRYTFYDSSKAAREFGYASRGFDAILEESVRAIS